jgi:hypothetical protein
MVGKEVKVAIHKDQLKVVIQCDLEAREVIPVLKVY